MDEEKKNILLQVFFLYTANERGGKTTQMIYDVLNCVFFRFDLFGKVLLNFQLFFCIKLVLLVSIAASENEYFYAQLYISIHRSTIFFFAVFEMLCCLAIAVFVTLKLSRCISANWVTQELNAISLNLYLVFA